MKARIAAFLDDADLEFDAEFRAPWLFLGAGLELDGEPAGRVFVALQRDEEIERPFGRLVKEGEEWRGELRVAPAGLDLLIQGYMSMMPFQLTLNLELEPGETEGELFANELDVALTRFEPSEEPV
ncbi:MAG TPA: hypothetical protein VF559_06055 [Caulobacteraceae bacterium]|jgi:hypothetical protein